MRRRGPARKSPGDRRTLFLALLTAGATGVLALLIGVALGAARPSTADLTAEVKPAPGIRKAAIVDQVALTFPNPEFITQTQDILTRAGYTVDTILAEQVTVPFYRSLPGRGDKLLLIRSHATNMYNGEPGGPDALFTSEIYDKQHYPIEQVTDQVASARVVYGDDPTRYFSIMPNFVKRSMRGRFDDAVVILGGCQTLATGDLARALMEQGASVVVGWNEMVTLEHNDTALLVLLRNLVVEKLSPEIAVADTMAAVGPDPRYHSSMVVRTRE